MTPFARWLRKEMLKRGMRVGGSGTRGDGSRLARDVGIAASTMFRLGNGDAEPGLATIDKFADLWGYSRAEVLYDAEYLHRDDLAALCVRLLAEGVITAAELGAEIPRSRPARTRRQLRYPDQPEYQAIWEIAELDEEERRAAIYGVMALRFHPVRDAGAQDQSAASDLG